MLRRHLPMHQHYVAPAESDQESRWLQEFIIAIDFDAR